MLPSICDVREFAARDYLTGAVCLEVEEFGETGETATTAEQRDTVFKK